jgi:hypothetical protein
MYMYTEGLQIGHIQIVTKSYSMYIGHIQIVTKSYSMYIQKYHDTDEQYHGHRNNKS